MPVEDLENAAQVAEIPGQSGEEVARHVLAERFQMVDESPGEASTQVLAQREPCRRQGPSSENSAASVARGIDGEEELLLRGGVEPLDVVGHDELGARTLRGAQQVAATRTTLAPEIDDG